MDQSIGGKAVVEDSVGALPEGGRAKLCESEIQQPEPENIALIVSNHFQSTAQQSFIFAIFVIFTHALIPNTVRQS